MYHSSSFQMENVNVDAENARKKAPAFQECEVRLLMTLYTDSFEQFHRKFKGEEDQYPQYVRSVEECQPPQPSSPSPVECLDENQEEMDVEQGHTEECTPQRLTCTPRRKSKRVTHAARAREVLSLFTDRRQQWYEEERKLAVMRQEQAEEEKKLLKIKQDIAQAQLEHYLTSSYGHY
ncbi:hypothetical protein Y032_0005g2277 [Ancylostoma ceylanicum]|uniref:Uncharacterized protein n=2 Tax=Ancylostoma ceylanicum TaxID=53326 RepID=A0A016VQX1_9BILA|nr:hypothetical protein Y032_0005g2277 [Ancylostoma ceylanicum]